MIIVLLAVALALALGLLIWVPSTYVVGALATVFALLMACAVLWIVTNGDDPNYYTGEPAVPQQPVSDGRHAKK